VTEDITSQKTLLLIVH